MCVWVCAFLHARIQANTVSKYLHSPVIILPGHVIRFSELTFHFLSLLLWARVLGHVSQYFSTSFLHFVKAKTMKGHISEHCCNE